MNKLKNIKITTKIVILVLLLQFVTIALFSFFGEKNEELREKANMDEKLRVVAYAVNDFVLQEYHDRILDKNSISKEEYMNLLTRLSSFAQKAHVKYISSLVKRGSEILFTATSATPDDFAAGNYELFFENYPDATDRLINSFASKEAFHEETTTKYGHLRTIFVPFLNKYGEVYSVAIDIDVTYLEAIFNKNRERRMILAGIIFVISALISTLLINLLLKPIVVIRNALQEFFSYVNRKTTIISPINIGSGDELGAMGKLINDNIKVIAGNMGRDNDLIHEITVISEQVKAGSFSSRTQTEADNPALNDVKNIMNDVFNNMHIVMLDILGVLKDFSKNNYRSKLESYDFKGEMDELVREINKFGKKSSDMMLNIAYDAINLEKDSSFLNDYMAGLTEKLNMHLKELTQLKEVLQEGKRFSTKSVASTTEVNEQKLYAQELLVSLKKKIEVDFFSDAVLDEREKVEKSLKLYEMISDISHSMDLISKDNDEIKLFLNQTMALMDKLSTGLDLYEERILDGRKSIDQTQKVSNNLKGLSRRMREYIEKSDFTGKENINTLMNYTDR